MSLHEPKHRDWLERLASGELPGDSAELRALERCAECREEALELRSVHERLAAVDAERRAILVEIQTRDTDPAVQARVERALSRREPRQRDSNGRRWWFRLLAASLVLACGAYFAWRGARSSDDDPSRGQTLGQGEHALGAPELVRESDGALRVTVSRPPAAGCVLGFMVEDPADVRNLFSKWTPERTCTIPAASIANWPPTVDVFVLERSEGDVDVAASPRVSWSR